MLREKQSEEMIVCLQESTPVEAFVSKHLLQMEQTEVNEGKGDYVKDFFFFSHLFVCEINRITGKSR